MSLHGCGGCGGPEPPLRRPAAGPPAVDVHCHVLVPAVEERAAGHPGFAAARAAALHEIGGASAAYNAAMIDDLLPRLTDADQRLRDMDAMGVGIQVLSPSPTQYHAWAPPDLAVELVALQNEAIAALCARRPDRFVGLGAVALQHPDLAADQLRRGMVDYGFRGVEIPSRGGPLELSDHRLALFWAAAEEAGALLLLHAASSTLGERGTSFYLSNIVGQPLETTLALSHLMFGGVLDRFPDLKLCLVHGGGFLPHYVGRFDHGHRARPETGAMAQSPSAYLRRLHVETLLFEPADVARLVARFGIERVMVGTDYPFDMGHYDLHGLIAAVPGLDEGGRAAILSGNASRLLRL